MRKYLEIIALTLFCVFSAIGAFAGAVMVTFGVQAGLICLGVGGCGLAAAGFWS